MRLMHSSRAFVLGRAAGSADQQCSMRTLQGRTRAQRSTARHNTAELQLKCNATCCSSAVQPFIFQEACIVKHDTH